MGDLGPLAINILTYGAPRIYDDKKSKLLSFDIKDYLSRFPKSSS